MGSPITHKKHPTVVIIIKSQYLLPQKAINWLFNINHLFVLNEWGSTRTRAYHVTERVCYRHESALIENNTKYNLHNTCLLLTFTIDSLKFRESAEFNIVFVVRYRVL